MYITKMTFSSFYVILLFLCLQLGGTRSLECTFSDDYQFYADPLNCSQYYECHRGQKRVISCAPNFYWNDNEKYCDFDTNVNCGDSSKTSATRDPITQVTTESPGFTCPTGSADHTHHADPYDCSKYYECQNGKANVYSCPPGFFFNVNEKVCDFPNNVQCKLTPKPSPTVLTTPSPTKSPNFICPAGADEHTHYSDPDDCSKYYECHNGKPVVYSCPPGFFFNFMERMCDFPDNVQCQLTRKPSPTQLTTPSQIPTKSPRFVCPVNSDKLTHYADPDDCSKYYECHNGKALVLSCPIGFLFNAKEGVCDFPESVQCGQTPETTEIPTTKNPGFVCPAGSDGRTHHADPYDCSKYYDCQNGRAVEYSCPSGFFFNEIENVCDFPENVQCKLTPKPSPTQVTTSRPSTKSPVFVCPATSDEHTHYADPDDCSKYFDCHDGKAVEYSCAPGFLFNTKEGVCDFSDNVQCSLTTEVTTPLSTTEIPGFACPDVSDESIHYANPKNCSKYFECHNGNATEYSCAPGFLFNSEEGFCDFEDNVKCIPSSKTSATRALVTEVTTPVITTESQDPSTREPKAPSCVGKADGTYLSHPDCKKFIECVGGREYTFNCSSGTFWNEKELTCDSSRTTC